MRFTFTVVMAVGRRGAVVEGQGGFGGWPVVNTVARLRGMSLFGADKQHWTQNWAARVAVHQSFSCRSRDGRRLRRRRLLLQPADAQTVGLAAPGSPGESWDTGK